MKLIVFSIIILGVCVVLLGIKVLFVKGARFPSGHVHSSPALRRRGVTCASGSHDTMEKKQKTNNHAK
ncbi:MAG: hypothetical protein K2L74_03080 [Muribaculaceae bacterium]|nr:hypothetical protein [Muribaculaceae bacterium]MDE6540977.1 hypothetical protein [Muribaculaceae bacterium]